MQAASVTAILEGSDKAFQAYTGKDGTYRIDIPAGNVKVRAAYSGSKGKLSKYVNVSVPDDGNATANLQLLDYATVNYKLYTVLNGVKEGPVTFDWRVAYHYHMETSLPILAYGPPFQVAGVAGDKFRVCVDGREGALPTACDEVTIPDSNQAELEMTLQGIGAQVTASYINEETSSENNVNLQVFRIEGGKIAYKNVSYRRIGDKYLIDIPEPGDYRLVAYGQGGKTAVTEFKAAASENKELSPQVLSAKGKFAGQEGNGISVSRDMTTPGGTIVARVLYTSRDASQVVSAEDAEVMVELPDALEYIPTSLVVNGQPAEGTLSDGKLTVHVGTIKGGVSGAVQFSLKVKDQSLDDVTFLASMRYKGAPEERLGSAAIRLSYATIQAPEVVAKQEFTVSGTSFPGSKVDVYDGDVLLGEAQVSLQGGWVLGIRLPGSELSNHELRTIVQTGGPGVAGQTALVHFDPNDPGLEQISMRQGDGRVQNFLTDSGVAVFPFVYVPGQPFQYKLKFRDPSRISNVKVWMGLESADATLVGNEFVTSMILKGDPGPITVTYDKKEVASETPANPPTEGELRSTLPQSLRNYQVSSVTPPGGTTPDGTTLPSNTVSGLIHMNENIDAKVTISRTTTSGSPTDLEKQKMEKTGIQVFGTSTSQTGGSKSRTFTVKMKVPGEVAAALTGDTNKASSLSSLAVDPQEIALIIEMLNRGTQAYDLSSGIMSLVSPGAIERINADYEAALALCDPQAAEYYSDFAMEIKYDIAWHEFFKNAINILSTKLEGVGSLLFWAESYWAGQELDNIVNNELEELESHLKQYDCKIKPFPSKPPKKPLAKPKYIYDPSGYVYEGMTSNRLEE
ncbi:carboxypeptidase-like regulatory domain-containing protein [Paenibacillus hexagrammi]|uniref:Carboxypeptidase-like regulatory domain-containing protein n=1 Tax=Paenibacillus hexagrammi TaxID=2908839 RepID=A0ABY3SKL8_9BACL|nr:carboxypeptidase-like regulatory domain-containing protein [Paenibacillus sp. YPD9-1]UJF34018.1 carboxypeptidase-like regulatory domain-containing protein [Paenibacillus sp. YPD9-1]